MVKEILPKKYRWFIWCIVIIVAVGLSLAAYAYITGINIETETSEIVVSFRVLRKGKIKVVSNPDQAKIYLDGKDTGKETNATVSTKPGTHILKLTKDGYKDYIVEIQVKRGEIAQISVGLEEGEGVTYPQEVSETSDWETYTNEEYGYEINYPQDWKIEDITAQKVNSEGPWYVTSEYLLNVLKISNNEGWLDIWTLSNKEGTIDNKFRLGSGLADKEEISFTGEEAWKYSKDNYYEIVILKGTYIYSITSNTYDKSKSDIDQMLSTFQFTK